MLPRLVFPLFTLAVVSVAATQEPYAVVGVPVDPRASGVPLRKNINDLEAIGGAQW